MPPVDTAPLELTDNQPIATAAAESSYDTALADKAVVPNAASGPPQKSGVLIISVSPADAQVFADERPFSAKEMISGKRLKAGSYFIVSTADGYEPYWGSLDIAENLTSTLSIRLTPLQESCGVLRISVTPPATVYIDGIFRGVSLKLPTVKLKAGEHYVTLRSRGHRPFERSIMIDSGATAHIEAKLEPSGK